MPIKKRNKISGKMEWYGLIKHNGKQQTKRCQTAREAKAWEAAKWASIESDINSKNLTCTDTEKIICIEELITLHLKSETGHKSKGTINTKRLAYQRLLEYIDPETPATRVRKADIRNFLDKLGRDVSPNTANASLVALNRLYNWAIKLDIIPDINPCKTLEKLRTERHERYIPPLNDFLKVICAADKFEDRLLLTLFYVTLARHREILNLQWNDVNFETSTITLWTGKRKGGRQADKIEIDEQTIDMLRIHKKETNNENNNYVFINKKTGTKYDSRDDLLDRLINKANVKRFTMHGIRHLAASIMAESGESLSTIQAMCRHRNPSTTDKYIHSLNGRAASKVLSKTAQKLFHSTD